MPIRMVDDPRDPDENSGDDSGGGGGGFDPGGGGGGIFGLLLLLLGLFRGRGLIFLLVIGIIGYFFLGRGGCHARTVPQSHSLPSASRSNHRPPTRGSTKID